MGIDAGDLVGLGGFADQQVMVDAQLDFAADHHVVLEEAVEGVVDRALGGVLHRHHAEVHRTGGHFTEHLVDGGHRHADHGMTEVLHRRSLAEGALGAEVGDLERVLQGQAGRHDFAEQPRHFLVAQRALVALHDALEHLGLALGAIEHRRLAILELLHLHPRHFFGAARAVADQLEDALIEVVDAQAQRLQLLFRHIRRAPSRTRPCRPPAPRRRPGRRRCRWKRACRPPSGALSG